MLLAEFVLNGSGSDDSDVGDKRIHFIQLVNVANYLHFFVYIDAAGLKINQICQFLLLSFGSIQY